MFATTEHMLHTSISTGTLKHMTPQNPDEVEPVDALRTLIDRYWDEQ
jgi:hypothetical protein